MNSSGFSTNLNHSNDNFKSGIKEILLPDKCFEKRVAATWRRGNQFSVYPRSQSVNKAGEKIDNNVIFNIRQDIMIFSPILRKLVNESNGTFISLQKMPEAVKNSENPVEFLKLSRQYRSIIRVCIESLQDASLKENNELEKHKLLSYITIFYSIECIWHLCEILYIDNIPGDIVLPYLLEWVRFHFPCHEQSAAQLLEDCERGSESHTAYWDTVVGMIVQGRVDVARALLKLHSAADSNEFKLIDNSLRSMPVFNVYGGISTGDFTITWKHWQAECRSKLSSRTLASHPNLELILRLITGDYAAFESIRDRYSAWFDLLGGWVMYTGPVTRRRELGTAAAACAGMRTRGPPSHSPLDRLISALADGQMHQLLHDIQQMSDNGWFATHLTDILYHSGKLKILDKHQVNVTTRLRDSLILEYGCTLMEHRSLWSAGLSYLASCKPEGPRRAELLLERIPIHSAAKAMRIIAEAKKHGMLDVAESVSGCMSARLLSAGRAGGALAWAVRGRSAPHAGRAAALALQACAGGEAPGPADLLLTIGPHMLLHPMLLLLGKYCEFHSLYKKREFKAAGKLLASLLTSKITPDFFWETLLLDTLPLLESDEVIFDAEATNDTMLLLAAREHMLSTEKADLLRLALTRNLAKALLAPEE